MVGNRRGVYNWRISQRSIDDRYLVLSFTTRKGTREQKEREREKEGGGGFQLVMIVGRNEKNETHSTDGLLKVEGHRRRRRSRRRNMSLERGGATTRNIRKRGKQGRWTRRERGGRET